MQGMDPEIQAFFEKMFAGNSGPAPAGPPGMEGLEGGWSHIPRDPMAFITELLTPQNVQRTTQFAGGSHYGPDRNKSIPAQNFAQAEALLKMMSDKDAYTRDSEMGGMADDIMRRTLEFERSAAPQGSEEKPSFVMGDKTGFIPGKLGEVYTPSDSERSLLQAGGYPDTRLRPTGYGSTPDPSKGFKEAREYLGQLMEMQRSAQTEEEAAAYNQEIASVRQYLSSQFGGGSGGAGDPNEKKNEPGPLGEMGATASWFKGLVEFLGSIPNLKGAPKSYGSPQDDFPVGG